MMSGVDWQQIDSTVSLHANNDLFGGDIFGDELTDMYITGTTDLGAIPDPHQQNHHSMTSTSSYDGTTTPPACASEIDQGLESLGVSFHEFSDLMEHQPVTVSPVPPAAVDNNEQMALLENNNMNNSVHISHSNPTTNSITITKPNNQQKANQTVSTMNANNHAGNTTTPNPLTNGSTGGNQGQCNVVSPLTTPTPANMPLQQTANTKGNGVATTAGGGSKLTKALMKKPLGGPGVKQQHPQATTGTPNAQPKTQILSNKSKLVPMTAPKLRQVSQTSSSCNQTLNQGSQTSSDTHKTESDFTAVAQAAVSNLIMNAGAQANHLFNQHHRNNNNNSGTTTNTISRSSSGVISNSGLVPSNNASVSNNANANVVFEGTVSSSVSSTTNAVTTVVKAANTTSNVISNNVSDQESDSDRSLQGQAVGLSHLGQPQQSESNNNYQNLNPPDTTTAHVNALTSPNWVAACASIPSVSGVGSSNSTCTMNGGNDTQGCYVPSTTTSMEGVVQGQGGVAGSALVDPSGNGEPPSKRRRQNLNPEERARQNRDRNREHARNTRLRKKAYVEELKRTLTELVAQRDAGELERRHAAQRELEQREVRFRVVEEFLRLRGNNEVHVSRWVAILEESFVLIRPATPFRGSVAGVEASSSSGHHNHHPHSSTQVCLHGATECMADASSLGAFLGTIGCQNLQYNCDRSQFLMDGTDAVLSWTANSIPNNVGANGQGSPSIELVLHGTLKASFSPASNKLASAELCFDTGAVTSQIRCHLVSPVVQPSLAQPMISTTSSSSVVMGGGSSQSQVQPSSTDSPYMRVPSSDDLCADLFADGAAEADRLLDSLEMPMLPPPVPSPAPSAPMSNTTNVANNNNHNRNNTTNVRGVQSSQSQQSTVSNDSSVRESSEATQAPQSMVPTTAMPDVTPSSNVQSSNMNTATTAMNNNNNNTLPAVTTSNPPNDQN